MTLTIMNCTDSTVTSAPLLDAVEYEEKDWESIFTQKHSKWTGQPTVELEDRWEKLVNGKLLSIYQVVVN